MSRNLCIVWSALTFILTSCKADSQVSKDQSDVRELITGFNSRARIITETDVDTSWCGIVSNPGIVEADFNGDNKKDYAMLLNLGKIKDSGNANDSHPQAVKTATMALVIFLSEKNGKFKTISSMKEHISDEVPPVNFFIQMQPARTIKEVDSDKVFKLGAPGILLTFCQRSAVVIYWNAKKKRLDEIWVAD